MEFILNDRSIKTTKPGGMTLLDFIRYEKHLMGTKIGCREGDCGACAVLIGTVAGNSVKYISMTSCITPLANVAGKHVVTIEGLNMPDLSPVQQAFVDAGGTQCGFCTVGFIVSLTGYCLTANEPSYEDAIGAIDGNICRCTGYKSIERATGNVVTGLKGLPNKKRIEWLVGNSFLPSYFSTIPERLAVLQRQDGQAPHPKPPFEAERTPHPKSLSEGERAPHPKPLSEAERAPHPKPLSEAERPPHPKPLSEAERGFEKGTIVGGGTDLYVQRPESVESDEVTPFFDRSDLRSFSVKDGVLSFGASTTVTDLFESPDFNKLFPNLKKHLKLVSSTPIRNMGTIGGNFVNASPIGDMTIFFLALNSSITLRKAAGQSRSILLRDFYKKYKTLDKAGDEFIETISFEIRKESRFNFEKVSKRTNLDIATVNTAIQVNLEGDVIGEVHIAAGGVGPVPMYLRETVAFLEGKILKPETVLDAIEVAGSEISPISDARGSKEYKALLLRQLIFAHFMELFPERFTIEKFV
jgi:xanthine dehydrogenase small subunit